MDGDGCSYLCQTEEDPEPLATCSDNIQNGNETGVDCGGDCPSCDGGGGGETPPPVVCGNSIVETGEQCDDGNVVDGDGCSYLCQTEEEGGDINLVDFINLQGSLVKTINDPRVYYVATNNQRYYIPNIQTYFSWFRHMSEIEVIDQVSLVHDYPYEGRLTVRPGNLIKFQDQNKVYVVEPIKTIRWITDINIFRDLGYDFSRVIHLPDSDFQYYTVGENFSSSEIHPTGQVLKHGNYPQVFYIKDGTEYYIKDEATFLGLGLKWRDVITIPVRYWYNRVMDNLQFQIQDW